MTDRTKPFKKTWHQTSRQKTNMFADRRFCVTWLKCIEEWNCKIKAYIYWLNHTARGRCSTSDNKKTYVWRETQQNHLNSHSNTSNMHWRGAWVELLSIQHPIAIRFSWIYAVPPRYYEEITPKQPQTPPSTSLSIHPSIFDDNRLLASKGV